MDGITTIEVVVKPNKFIDSYKFNKIIYKKDNKEEVYVKNTKISLPFFKDIEKFEDWQNIDSSVPQNYHLLADIDFTDRVNIKTNVNIARLEGVDNGHTIKNLTLTSTNINNAIIRKLTKSLKNVNFENITINNSRTSGDVNSIIRISYGDIMNVSLNNIVINAPKMSYSAPVAINRGYYVSDIILNNINIKGLNYSAGFVGNTLANRYNNINASNVTVVGQDNVGGIIGAKSYNSNTTFYDFTATNMNITGRSYVGAIAGIGAADNMSVTSSTISGTNYVGGISGHTNTGNIRNAVIRNSNIKGNGSYIGGAFGTSNTSYNIFVYNCNIEGLTNSTNYVGGLIGLNSSNTYESGILDSTVKSLGSNVGGAIGRQTSGFYYSFVNNTNVTGLNNVGGVTGYIVNGEAGYVYSNAIVTANANNAGGFYGYVNNQNTTNASTVSRIYQSIVTGGSITAANNAGGLIGATDVPLYNGHYTSTVIATSVSLTNQIGSVGPVVGSNREYSSLIPNLLVYDKTLINGTPVSQVANNGLTTAQLVTSSALKNTSTYTSKGFSTSRYDFSALSKGYFPPVKNGSSVVVINQVMHPLPATQMTMLRTMRFIYHTLPSVVVYSVDANKINVEFDKIDDYSTFTIKANDKISDSCQINKRVFSFIYDFKTPIEITISDGINEKTTKIVLDDIKRYATVLDSNYYYLKGNIIINNGSAIPGTYVNIYNNKALDTYGNVYDLSSMSKVASSVEKFIILDESIPLFTFTYNNKIIKTYNKFSIIEEDGIITTEESQLFIKNGKLEIIDSNLPSVKDSLIIDNYGGKSYQTVLGNDGIIYNIKTPINVPNDFINKDIRYMTNNLYDNSGFIVVSYKNGSFYGFDYRTGKRLFYDKVKVDMSIIDYFKEKLSTPNYIIDNTYDYYNKASSLEDKLIETSINEVLENIKQENNTDNQSVSDKNDNNYIIKYDYAKNDFIIIDEEELLSDDKEKISETSKIDANVYLIDFYFGSKNVLNISKNKYGILAFMISIGAILGSLIYLINIKILRKES
jgi:hypothetical protein